MPKEVEFVRIAADLEDNGHGRSCRLCRKRGRSGGRYNDGDPTMNQIGYHCREAIVLILRPPLFNRHIAPFNVTRFAQPIETRGPLVRVVFMRGTIYKTDPW